MKWHAGEPERMRLRDELDVKVEGNLRLRNPYGLTYRELAVLHLVAEGSADKQIAEALGISIYTANKHVGNILGKMNAASRTEAGVRALREGLLG
jgi:DNA-binding NarL/FixJ family response regulator